MKNKIHFYDRFFKPGKEELLKSLNVNVVKPKNDNYGDNWKKYFKDIMAEIEMKVK